MYLVGEGCSVGVTELDGVWKASEEKRTGTSWEHRLTCLVPQGDSCRSKMGVRLLTSQATSFTILAEPCQFFNLI